MLLSMTGQGTGQITVGNSLFRIEIKTLNSKYTDIKASIPAVLRPFELEIHKILTERLIRGTIRLYVYQERLSEPDQIPIQENVLKGYVKYLQNIASELSVPLPDPISTALRLPDVLKPDFSELSEEEWETFKNGLNQVIDKVIEFRRHEGETLEKVISSYIQEIETRLRKIEELEPERNELLRENLRENINKLKQNIDELDEARFEQEVLYYLIRMDFTEEKDRLWQHIKHFKETMAEDPPNGKKLTFIAQEIGREINTLSNKSQYAPIQKLAVEIKDYLNRIKEQLANVL